MQYSGSASVIYHKYLVLLVTKVALVQRTHKEKGNTVETRELYVHSTKASVPLTWGRHPALQLHNECSHGYIVFTIECM